MQLTELCAYLDTYLNAAAIKDCTTNGLQVQGKPQVQRIATAVTASVETIVAAIAWGADALFVHHGIFWNGQSPILVGPMGKRAALLLQNDISLLAYHLPLDMHPTDGNNWKAAAELGWKDCQPFGPCQGVCIGVKGQFSPIFRIDLCRQLEEYFGHKAHAAFGGKELVSSAGLISGGAYKSIEAAAAEGLDCFITGSFDEPAWHMAYENGINFFAMGHSATERIGPRAMAHHLAAVCGIESLFLDLHNPF